VVLYPMLPASSDSVYEQFLYPAEKKAIIPVHQSTWRHNPEDSHLHSHSRENLKSYQISVCKSEIDKLASRLAA
jgi:hypothetical protein